MATLVLGPDTETSESAFLRLPAEIRLQIYSYLVLPHHFAELLPSLEKISQSTRDYFDYEKQQHGMDRRDITDLDRPVLLMRTIDPECYPALYPASGSKRHTRALYSVRASRFRNRCMHTTYHCVNARYLTDKLAILRANRQVYRECSAVLYGGFTFDFDTHVEAIVPFLADLSPTARRCIRSVRLTKRALAYDKDFDRCEWANALKYLTEQGNDIALRRLELGVVAGRPGPQGWLDIQPYTATDMAAVQHFEGMEWIQSLLAITGLTELSVQAVVEHCPPVSNSSAMLDYVRFSASVESGFSDFLRQHLLAVLPLESY